jgi:hypothetical protein
MEIHQLTVNRMDELAAVQEKWCKCFWTRTVMTVVQRFAQSKKNNQIKRSDRAATA